MIYANEQYNDYYSDMSAISVAKHINKVCQYKFIIKLTSFTYIHAFEFLMKVIIGTLFSFLRYITILKLIIINSKIKRHEMRSI